MAKYYSFPLRLDEIIQQKQHQRCSLRESVEQNLFLIITTNFQESRFDASFGCSIWDEDFSVQPNSRWKDEVAKSIESCVNEYEKRLTKIRVRVEIEDHEFMLGRHNRRLKRRMGIWIEGFFIKTNERFEFNKTIYISPLSLE